MSARSSASFLLLCLLLMVVSVPVAGQCADSSAGAAGCSASQPDGDGDGVPDAADQCLETPTGTKVGASGCSFLIEGAKTAMVLVGVRFETGKPEITQRSETVLKTVAEALLSRPEVRGEVSGHTDNTGSATANQRLSQKRAEAVRQYLIDQGVAGDRLTAVGYGESKPIASNETEAGRARNRRVEFKRAE